MDLWIRSQDKQMLTKVDYLYLEVNDKREILGGNSYMINKSLGIYKSKERALEILDDIQRKLINRNYYYRIDEVVGLVPEETLNTNVIYEMPEE